MDAAGDKPYWQYVAVMDSRTRPSHASMNGKVLLYDHPWWSQNYPPNGFSCRCTVIALSRVEMERDDLKNMKKAPDIFDKGWGHNPGQWEVYDKNAANPGEILKGQLTWEDMKLSDLRDAISTKYPLPSVLDRANSREEAVITVMNALGLSSKNKVRIVETPIEEAVIHADRLHHMVAKKEDARERYANFIIPTLEHPYEIWITRYADGWRKQYIGLFEGKKNLTCIVRINCDGSLLWNIMQADDRKINKHRVGWLLWKK